MKIFIWIIAAIIAAFWICVFRAIIALERSAILRDKYERLYGGDWDLSDEDIVALDFQDREREKYLRDELSRRRKRRVHWWQIWRAAA